MEQISPYRLTVIAAIVVLVLSVGIVTVLGGPSNAAAYLGLVATVAVPGLLALFRTEQSVQIRQQQHAENQADILATNSKIDALAVALAEKERI